MSISQTFVAADVRRLNLNPLKSEPLPHCGIGCYGFASMRKRYGALLVRGGTVQLVVKPVRRIQSEYGDHVTAFVLP